MKKFFISVLVLIFSVMALNAATTKISTLGQSPFYGYVKDAETARMVVKENIGAVKYALNMLYGLERGNTIFFALCEQLDEAVIKERPIYSGTMFEGMLFKSIGFQRVLAGVEWEGEKPFKCFFFGVYYESYWIAIVIPRECGNISFLHLLGANESVPVKEEEEIVKIDEPETVEEEIRSEQEKPVRVEASLPRVTGVLDLSGAMVRKCYGKYLPGVRLGLRYRLDNQDRFAFVATGGFMMPLPINQSDSWEPFFLTDLTLQSRIYKFLSFGVGAGYSSKSRNYKVPAYWEGVANIGVRVKEVIFFFEMRIPWTWEEWNEVKSFGPKFPHKFIFGIRLPIMK